MNTFNISRFWNVARWDLTINRSFYTKTSVFIASIILLPVLMKYIGILWFRTSRIGTEMADTGYLSDDVILGQVGYIVFLIPTIMTVLMAYTFHNLLTRQGRINELTLPASNLERFLWHTLRTFVGGTLVLLASVLLADLIHVLLGWSVAGQHSFHSLTLAVLESLATPMHAMATSGSYAYICVMLTIVFYGFIHLSIFVLGNAIYYRHNLPKTVLWLIAISLCASVLMGFIVSFIVGHDVELESIMHFLKNISENGAATAALLCSLVVTAILWAIIYRLYCRAQITTRRNP